VSGEGTKLEQRVLILPPTRKDGQVTCALLEKAGLECVACADPPELAREILRGAGAVLLTEKFAVARDSEAVLAALAQQATWSDLPLVMLIHGGAPSASAQRVLTLLRNVTLLERPAPTRTVVSAVEAALRARQRQYQIREQLREIRHAEAAMRDLQEQYQFAIDASELGTFHCVIPLGKIQWNDRCKAHFWLKPDAEVDLDLFYAILHPADRGRTRAAIEACVGQDKPYEIEYRTVSPLGDVRWIRATGRTFFDAAGRPTHFDGTTRDITQKRVAQEALRETQERFEAMANSIPQLAWMARSDGWIFWFNRRWHDYCGTTESNMHGWGWTSVVEPHELPRVIDRWQRALASGEAWDDTFPLRRHDGEFRWHLSRAFPFRDAEGRIQLWFGTNTDVTDQRARAQERQQLLESEQAARRAAERANLMKDEFLATLSHELRTPLSAIFGWAQILKMSASDPQQVAEAVDVIDRNVRMQTQLIEDLLDMSRIISGKIRLDVQHVELPEVIRAAVEAVKPAIDAKGIRLEQVVDPRLGAVSGDFGRLQQVLWNLLTNAVKFTPKEGRIHVLAECVNSHVEVSVSDSGEGIDPEFLPHIFQRFSQADGSITRRHGGLGLGLSIVKSLVELHGGSVRADSAGHGQGATFTVRLPLRAARLNNEPVAHPRTPGPLPLVHPDLIKLRGVTVLIVDDEPDARELMKRFLINSEALPVLAASAAEAEQLLTTMQPDVIISDIGMPGEDGYEFMRHVRHNGVKAPAIALTAFARAEDRVRSLQAGFQAHLPKPVEPAELLAMIIRLHESCRGV
jgi:PAS domain S-box-containing protein